MERAVHRLSLGMEDVICIGDSYNDIPMIQRAGLGVAVANAEDPIKESADSVSYTHLCIYVTAFDQGLHFAQVFKVLEKMGYSWSKDLVHVPYGLVSLESGKLSTRGGNVVFRCV